MFVVFILALLLGFPLTTFGATVTCSWQDMSSGNSQEDYFILERRLGQTGSFFDIGHPPQNSQSHMDGEVIAGNEYCWRIKAHNVAGDSGYSNIACLTVPTQPSPPGVPQTTCSYSNPTNPPPTGLVLAMNFNAGTGTLATDSSGSNNTGTLNGPTWTNSGKYGKALAFDGGDWVTINDTASLDLTTAMTLEAWVYPTATPTNWSAVLIKQDSSELAYALYAATPSNRPNFDTNTGNRVSITGPTALPLNTWSHLAGTYDGSMMRLYVNGIQVASVARTGAVIASSLPLAVGRNLAYQEFFTGYLDEVRIYNRTLSASEISTDMNTAIP